jgi:hypothetical protein
MTPIVNWVWGEKSDGLTPPWKSRGKNRGFFVSKGDLPHFGATAVKWIADSSALTENVAPLAYF